MTTDQILQAKGEKLSQLLGEVLHKGYYVLKATVVCSSCGEKFREKIHAEERWSRKCPYVNCRHLEIFDRSYFYRKPDPIPLTPDNQVKWRGRAVEKYGWRKYRDALKIVFMRSEQPNWFTEYEFMQWLIGKIKPYHYLQAAALCSIKEQENDI